MRSDSCILYANSKLLAASLDGRRFTYSKNLLWILDYLSQHGKILRLKLGFCGRRNVRMGTRDGDFLNALKGIKTDELKIGNPRSESFRDYSVRSCSLCPPCQVGQFFIQGSL